MIVLASVTLRHQLPGGSIVATAQSVAAYGALLTFMYAHRRRLPRLVWAHPLLALLLLWCLYRIPLALSPAAAAAGTAGLIVGLAFVVIAIERPIPVFQGIHTAAMVTTVLSFASMVNPLANQEDLRTGTAGSGGFIGLFNSNAGMGRSGGLLVFTALALRYQGILSRRAFILSVVLGASGLYVSRSATGMIAALAAGGVFLITRVGAVHRVIRALLAAVAVVGTAVALSSVTTISDDISRASDRTEDFTGRQPLWSASWDAITERPVEGWHFGFWGDAEATTEIKHRHGAVGHGAHNGFLEVGIAYGAWVGAVGVVAALAALAKLFGRSAPAIGLLVFCLVVNMGSSQTGLPGAFGLITWWMVGAALASRRTLARRE